mmetsp:Transcript_39789/g.95201  ORF Transcript_39789/g.95201 Transcript_39789/m.95201 type:complete len:241 (+) Transcript_39789:499-1221(+)
MSGAAIEGEGEGEDSRFASHPRHFVGSGASVDDVSEWARLFERLPLWRVVGRRGRQVRHGVYDGVPIGAGHVLPGPPRVRPQEPCGQMLGVFGRRVRLLVRDRLGHARRLGPEQGQERLLLQPVHLRGDCRRARGAHEQVRRADERVHPAASGCRPGGPGRRGGRVAPWPARVHVEAPAGLHERDTVRVRRGRRRTQMLRRELVQPARTVRRELCAHGAPPPAAVLCGLALGPSRAAVAI